MSPERFAGRAVVLILLAVGYYAIALGVAALSLFLVWIQIVVLHSFHFVTLFFLVASGAILWSIVPRFSRFVAPGPALSPAEHPQLFALLGELASAAAIAGPRQVFLTMDDNAGVAERGLPGLRRKVLFVGLPLFQVLSVAQLQAVLAHEFGHYRGGDARLGAIAYRTHLRIERTVAQLARSGSRVANVFLAYGRLFLRVTRALSRAQETAADLFAARLSGSEHASKALESVAMLDGVVPAFWREEVEPVLRAGFRPALLDLFGGYVRAAPVHARMVERLRRERSRTLPDPFDSHPLLQERIAAIQRAGSPASDAGRDRLGTSLLNLPRAEDAMLRHLLGDAAVEGLRAAPWDDLEAAYVAIWGADLRRVEAALHGARVDEPPAGWGALIELAAKIATCLDVEIDEKEGKALAGVVFGEALSLLLHRRGWTIHKSPGEEVRASGPDGVDLEPFRLLRRLSSVELGMAEWRETCERIGLAGVALAEALDAPTDRAAERASRG